MDTKLNVELNIEGTTIEHFNSFILRQAFNEHHYFELRYNNDQMGQPGLISLDNCKDYVGKNLTAQFGVEGGSQQTFTGKVTKVELAQSHGYHGVVIVSGFSPSILIDRGPDMGSYLAKDLSEIIRQATQDAPSNDLSIQLNPARKAPIDYIIQYRESDFDFLNRLSAEYYEWFYYDGVQLNFGKPDQDPDEVQLVYGRDVQSLQYGMTVAPLKYNRFAYNPSMDELLQSESTASAGGQPDQSFAVGASNNVYSKVFNQPTAIRIDSQSDMDSLVSNEAQALVGDLVRISASATNPQIKLGGVVDISMSLQQGVGDFSTQSLGKFLVTSVNHQMDGLGHYYSSFDGIVSGTQRISVPEYRKPEPDFQLADVIDNNDPQKQGRIKVKFKWTCGCNDTTEWLRVVSPNAGNGDKGSNRGFLVIPEIGDQVVIGFEEGNIARPVVLGSVYNGKTANSGQINNSSLKTMTSRMGSILQFNDIEHTILLQTSSGNSVKVDEKNGAINILTATVVNVNAGETINVTSGTSMSFSTKKISVNGSESIDIQSPKITMGSIGGKQPTQTIEIMGKAVTVQGDDSLTQGAKDVTVSSSEKNITLNAKTNIEAAAVSMTKITGGQVEINQS